MARRVWGGVTLGSQAHETHHPSGNTSPGDASGWDTGPLERSMTHLFEDWDYIRQVWDISTNYAYVSRTVYVLLDVQEALFSIAKITSSIFVHLQH